MKTQIEIFEELMTRDILDHGRFAVRRTKELKTEFFKKVMDEGDDWEYHARWSGEEIVKAEHTSALLSKLVTNVSRIEAGELKITLLELIEEWIATLRKEIVDGRFIQRSTNAIDNQFKLLQQQAQAKLVEQIERAFRVNAQQAKEQAEDAR